MEKTCEKERSETWHEVMMAALLSFPERRQPEPVSIEALAALSPGTAIVAEIAIGVDGAVSAALRQLVSLSTRPDRVPSLAQLAPALAPGARLKYGESARRTALPVEIVPRWTNLLGLPKSPRPLPPALPACIRIPHPASGWPWNISRALAVIAAGGGGTLAITARLPEESAWLVRRIADYHHELVAASYANSDDRRIVVALAHCRNLQEDPAMIAFEVTVAGEAIKAATIDLVAMALFGTLSDPQPTDAEADLRLLAGSAHGPSSLLPFADEIAELLSTAQRRSRPEGLSLVIGTSGGGISVGLSERDRARHLYVIGATGTGKSTLLKDLIRQDMAAGEGVVLLDPHGDLAEEVVDLVPAGRRGDLVYADAADLGGRFALDLLPDALGSAAFEIAADTLVGILRSDIYPDVKEAFGPMFETYFRSALALLVCADSEDRYLANFPRVFEDRAFRSRLLDLCTNADVVNFWRKTALRAGGEAELTNITPYVTGKLTRFIMTNHARAMFPLAQQCLDFSGIMDAGGILILRCPKGAIGEGLTDLAMSACLMKIRAATMARRRDHYRRPVRLYIDEFQSCRGSSLQTLLAEGRKFGISLVLANQSLGQIGGGIASAVLANVGNLVTFRLGAGDAATLAPWLSAPERWRELCWLPDFRMQARLLDNGYPVYFQGIEGPYPALPGTGREGVAPRVTAHQAGED